MTNPTDPADTPEPDQRVRRPRRGSGAMTLSDVAKLAGVSPITASRALNKPELVSQDARQRVREAVERTGYVPNRLAGGLASSRSRLVTALVPSVVAPVFLQTIQSLTETLAAAGYQLMLGQSGYADSREDALLDAIIGRRPDGIVLTGILHSAVGRRRLIASGIPVVETWDITPNPIDMLVGFSHEKIGAAVASYLAGKGRRAPALLTGDDARALRRNDGFLATAGADVPVCLVPAPTTLGSGRKGLVELLHRAPHIDAVFCSSDLLALGVLIEAQIQGLAVPDRLAVVGFGDLAFAADLAPPLTTVRIDGTRIGRLTADCLIERAEGRQVAERIVDVGFSIVERASA